MPTPRKGTPEYERWKDSPEYAERSRKISAALTGRKSPWTSERNKLQDTRGEKNSMWGKHHSKKSNEKNRIAHLGRHHTARARKKISIAMRGKNNPMFGRKRPDTSEMNKTEEIRKKRSASKIGKKRPDISGENHPRWNGGVSFLPYCEKFNRRFKRRVRAFQHNRCALCGHVWQPGEPLMTVHHIHANKDSCCDDDAPRMFVCLCARKKKDHKACHQLTIGKETVYAGRFIRYIIKNFGGKSYFTEEEYEEYCKNGAA
jgi:ribosomal protein L31